MPFVLFSCFEFVGTGNTAKRLLNLAIAAPGDVAKIHVAVYDGALTPDRVVYNQSFTAGSSLNLELPAGVNRYIVVWAEGFNGTGIYFGSIGPVTIQEQDTDSFPLPIQMTRFHTSASTDAFNVQLNYPNLTWNGIPGAITYEIQFSDFGESKVTTVNASDINGGCCTGTIRVLNSVFNIPSESSNPTPNWG